jgi:hypothetical protein
MKLGPGARSGIMYASAPTGIFPIGLGVGNLDTPPSLASSLSSVPGDQRIRESATTCIRTAITAAVAIVDQSTATTTAIPTRVQQVMTLVKYAGTLTAATAETGGGVVAVQKGRKSCADCGGGHGLGMKWRRRWQGLTLFLHPFFNHSLFSSRVAYKNMFNLSSDSSALLLSVRGDDGMISGSSECLRRATYCRFDSPLMMWRQGHCLALKVQVLDATVP